MGTCLFHITFHFFHNSPLPFVKFWNCRTRLICLPSSYFVNIFKKCNSEKISTIRFANFLTWYEAEAYTKNTSLQEKLTGDAINLVKQI